MLRRRALPFTDRRTSLMNEIVSAIRLVKMYAWEESFLERVKEARAQEVKHLRKAAFVQSFSLAVTPSITVVAAVATIVALTYVIIILFKKKI